MVVPGCTLARPGHDGVQFGVLNVGGPALRRQLGERCAGLVGTGPRRLQEAQQVLDPVVRFEGGVDEFGQEQVPLSEFFDDVLLLHRFPCRSVVTTGKDFGATPTPLC